MSNVDIPLGPAPARCATHPEADATGTCARCGTFFCGDCVQQVFGKAWCATCAARPEVNYLEQYRLKLWGKRDGSAWMALVIGAAFAVAAAVGLVQRSSALNVVAFTSCAAAGICFFLGLRWAREAFIAVPVLFGIVGLTQRSQGMGVVLFLLGMGSLPIYFDPRNQLFFRRPVSRKRLERLWQLQENNPSARKALSLALGSIFIPVFAPFAVFYGVMGLRQVNPDAVPPIGRKGQAIFAIVLGGLTTLLWGAVLVSQISARIGFSLGK